MPDPAPPQAPRTEAPRDFPTASCYKGAAEG